MKNNRRAFAQLLILAAMLSCDSTGVIEPDDLATRRGNGARNPQAGGINPPGTPSAAIAPLTIESGFTNANAMAQALVGQGVVVADVVYTGDATAAGVFTGGTGIVGFESGIILSTGRLADVPGPNSSGSTSTELDHPGDSQLTTLSGQNTLDASVLEFRFTPNATQIFIQFVFGSEEYNEFVGSFNDAFAFFVNGVNCARSASGTVVSVNTINLQSNAAQFRNNEFPSTAIDVEMDGLTTVLTCTAQVPVGVPSTMKLAIADALDGSYDSNVFIRAGSLTTNLPPIAVAGADLVRECTGVNTNVALSGSGSSDPNGTITSYRWLRNGVQIATGVNPTVSLAIGVHNIVLEVTDNGQATATDALIVTVQDTGLPTLNFNASPLSLTPADHTYRTITPTASGSDLCGGTVTLSGTIVSNETDNAPARDGTTTGDIRVTRPGNVVVLSSAVNPVVSFTPATDAVQLRAERRTASSDRQYTLTVTASDARGNSRNVVQTVVVPR